jgi:uncharacterized protein DUF402
MYPRIRIDKRIPDGTIWQARRGYLLPPHAGWTRVYAPVGTEWTNTLGRWKTQTPGLSLFSAEHPFTIACHGPAGDKRFYIDIAHRVRIAPELIEFTDLFLDVLIEARGVVTEKDEYQLAILTTELQHFVRAARDEVRQRIASSDPLFDATSPYFDLPDDAAALPPLAGPLEIS